MTLEIAAPSASPPMSRDTISAVVSEPENSSAKAIAMIAIKTMNIFMIKTSWSSQLGRPESTDEKAAFDVYTYRNFFIKKLRRKFSIALVLSWKLETLTALNFGIVCHALGRGRG